MFITSPLCHSYQRRGAEPSKQQMKPARFVNTAHSMEQVTQLSTRGASCFLYFSSNIYTSQVYFLCSLLCLLTKSGLYTASIYCCRHLLKSVRVHLAPGSTTVKTVYANARHIPHTASICGQWRPRGVFYAAQRTGRSGRLSRSYV